MVIRLLTWNVFHGRDWPPDPALVTWRSRLLRVTERNETHVQVNRPLRREFESWLAQGDWDVALLQEFPPRWREPIAMACGADSAISLTSRNGFAALRAFAARLNPDLIASNEGGSNLVLARGAAGSIVESAELELTPGPDPERRTMGLARLACGLCVANVHASAGAANRAHAEAEVLNGADHAIAWAAGSPLVFGGDLNLRPRQSRAFEQLAERGLAPATAADSIDHLLIRGAAVVSAPVALADADREIAEDGLALRLSDHAPVKAVIRFDAQGGGAQH